MPDRVRHDALGGWMPDHPVKYGHLFHRSYTGIHSFPAKLHGCRITSGMTLWEDGYRITP